MKMDSLTNITTYKQRVCSLLLLMILLTVNIFRVSAQTLTRGSGTSDDPYQLSTPTDLMELSEEVNAGHVSSETYFVLTADIDMSSVPNFTPIGTGSHPFNGYFDGDRYTILNLKVDLPEKDTVGLFGYASNGANINNLNLMAASIQGRNYVGGILGAGYLNVSLSTNTVSGTISGNDYVGGVVGNAYNQIRVVENTCTADITSTGVYSGGIAGCLTQYAVCSFNIFAGRLMASQDAGGVVGLMSDGGRTSTMTANLSVGSFTPLSESVSNVGAVAGVLEGSGLTVKNNFYDKQMMIIGLYGVGNAASDIEGQITGKLTVECLGEGLKTEDPNQEYRFSTNHFTFTEDRYPYISNSPYDKVSLAAAAPAKLYTASSTDYETILKIKSAFTVCLEGVVWKSSDTNVFEVGYYGAAPLLADTSVLLIAMVDTIPIRYVPLYFASEAEGFHLYGTKPNPIMINSKSELERLRDATNNKTNFKGVSGANGFADNYFIQTTDLAYNNDWNPVAANWLAIDAWNTSIGCDANHPFKGNYDGQNHSITRFAVFSDGSSSSSISYPLADYRGLFGYLKDASIENLHVAGAVYARNYVGLMAGYAENTSFTNCSPAAPNPSNSTSQVTASVSYAGGLVGMGKHVTIHTYDNTVDVKAASYMGGVVGSVSDTSRISFANNTAAITSTGGSYTGGIVGELGSPVGFCTVDNCNNSGAVTGYGHVAGIAAVVNTGSTVDDRNAAVRHCNNTAPIKGNTYVGGIIGYGKAVAVEYCTMNNAAVTAASNYVGGIAAYLTYNAVKDATYPDTAFSTLNNCSSAAQITTEQNYAGGIAGVAEYVKDIHDLSNEGTTLSTTTTTSGYFGGFFGSTNRLTLKNLTNKATVTASADYNGGIIGRGDIWTSIDSCHNEADITGKGNTGGLVGQTEGYTSMTNSDNEGTVTSLGGNYVGGVMGSLYANPKSGFKGFDAHNLTNNGPVTGTSTSSVGGVIGSLDGHGRYHNKVTNLKNNASVTGKTNVGGVFGLAMRYVYMDTLENGGSVTNTVGSYTGGVGALMGSTSGSFDTLKHAKNYGDVNGMGYVAGIVAGVSPDNHVYARGELIDSCENHGMVTATDNYAGGLIAYTRGSTIKNSYNDGKINSTSGNLGGLIGYANWTYNVYGTYTDTAYCILDNLVNNADIESNNNYTGGAVGNANYCDIRNLTNNGNVIGMIYTGGLIGGCTLPCQPLDSTNCHVGREVAVQGYSNVGGLVGTFNYGVIRDYENYVKVTSDNKSGFAGNYVGGVAGYTNGRVLNGDTIPVKFINVKNHGEVYGPATSGAGSYGGVLGYNELFLLMDSCENYAAVEGSRYVGGLVGCQQAGFSKIQYSDNYGMVTGNYSDCTGGIVGLMGSTVSYDTVMYCRNYGVVNSVSSSVGGIIGKMNYYTDVSNRNCYIDSCMNTATVTGTATVGGIAGSAAVTTIIRCHNKAAVEGTTGGTVGGIVGYMTWNSKVNETITDTCVSKIFDCTNVAPVTSHGDYTGGIVGDFAGGHGFIERVYNAGDVTGVNYTGGYIGRAVTLAHPIRNWTNTVKVTATGNEVGGLIGRLQGFVTQDSVIAYPQMIVNCHNKGEITTTKESVGGLVGNVRMGITIDSCDNVAPVTGGSKVGGIVGDLRCFASLSNCLNTADITLREGSSGYMGGIAGYIHARQDASWGNSGYYPVGKVTAYNLENRGKIYNNTSGAYTGGVIGYFHAYNTPDSWGRKLYNRASVIAASTTGGVIGKGEQHVVLDSLYNEGNVKSNQSYVGGIVGNLSANSILTKAMNCGEVTSDLSYAGGVVGWLGTYSKVIQVTNSANVIGNTYVGGVAAYQSYSNIFDVINVGNVLALSSIAGGIVGYVSNADKADDVNDTLGIVRYAINAGVVSSINSVGGVVGQSCQRYSSPQYDNVINVGDVFSRTNINTAAAIIGDLSYETFSAKLSVAYFDKQMCLLPNAIYQYTSRNTDAPMLTIDMLGSSLSSVLDAEHWHFAEGRYPVPKGLEKSPAGIIASMPIFLRNDGESNYENVGLVHTDFSVATDEQVSYSNKPEGVVTISSEGAATIGDLSSYFQLTDTLSLTCNGETRDVYLHFNGDSALTVDNLQDLRNLRDAVNNGSGTYKGHFSDNGFKGVAFIMTANIDMSDEECWVPIGRYIDGTDANDRPFRGIFHGNNDTISHLNAKYQNIKDNINRFIGLFGCTDGATVDSLHMDNTCAVKAYDCVGAIVGWAKNKTKIIGCSSAAEVQNSTDDYGAGGIVGKLRNYSVVDGCRFSGKLIGPYWKGGIAGSVDLYSEVNNSVNSGIQDQSSGSNGGIVAILSNNSAVTACLNEADFISFNTNQSTNGGVVGSMSKNSKIVNCVNRGNIKSANAILAGVVGKMSDKCIVTSCINEGQVSNTSSNGQVGGIVGLVENGSSVDECVNVGEIIGINYVGGLVGKICAVDTVYRSSLTHSLNAGPVTGKSMVGGVVGLVSDAFPVTVAHNINNALINSNLYQGALIGNIEYPELCVIDHNFSDKQLCLANMAVGSDDTLLAQNLKFTIQLTGESLNNVEGLDEGWTFEDKMYPRPSLLKDSAVVIVVTTPLFMDTFAHTAAGYETLNRIDTLVGLGTAHDVVWTGSANMDIEGDTAYIVYGECRTDTARLTVTLDGYSRTFDLKFGDIGNDWSRLTIDNMEDLKAFQHAVNYGGSYKCVNNVDGFAGKHFELTFDPDLAKDDETKDMWEPVGWYRDETYLAPFKGHFHGGGHTISHINIPNNDINLSKYVERTDNWKTTSYRGFFGYIVDATVDSLKVQGHLVGGSYKGFITGSSINSTISNCEILSSLQDSSYIEKGDCNGGVVGIASSTILLSNINHAGINASSKLGGIVGYAKNVSTISNCKNFGSITASIQYVAGIVGVSEDRTQINYCENYADIFSSYTAASYVAGVSGKNGFGCPISYCVNIGNITTRGSYAGGICAYHGIQENASHDMSNCINIGDVTADKQYVGGIVGYGYRHTSHPDCYISNVANYGNVNGGMDVGGILGQGDAITMLNAISTGAVNPLSNRGGIAGASITTTLSHCYYDAQMCGAEYAVLGDKNIMPEAKRLTKQLLGDSILLIDDTFSEDIWTFSEGRYPRLKFWQDSIAVLVASTPIFLNDSETVRRVNTFPFAVANYDGLTYSSSHPEYVYVDGDSVRLGSLPNDTLLVITLTGSKEGYVHTIPFLVGSRVVLTIDSLPDLAAFRDAVNNGTLYKGVSGEGGFSGFYIVLTTDIDMSDSCSAALNKSWTPIGNSVTSFKGTFLGKGHHISHLYIEKTADQTINDYQGLFGAVCDGGSIDSLHVSGDVTGRAYVGGIVGFMHNHTLLTNCSFEGSVTGRSNQNYAGGLVGALSYDGVIRHCQANALVNGGSKVGGLVGQVTYNNVIEHSINFGNVTASSDYAGGLFGYTSDKVVTKYCMNAGTVCGVSYVGGLYGANNTYDTTLYCCNIGMVVATSDNSKYIGGLFGACPLTYNRPGSLQKYNLNAGPIVCSANTSYVGGITGHMESTQGKIDNNINVANVIAYTTLVGGACGYNYRSSTCMNYNIFNVQLCPWPTFGNCSDNLRTPPYLGDRYTSEIVGTALRDAGVEGFTDENWVFAEGMYPRPKGIDTTTIAKLAATPIFLYESGSLSDNVNAVRKNFAITTNADGLTVDYASAQGLQFEGDSAKVDALTGNEVLHDTLTLSANGIQRYIFLDLYPKELPHEYQLTIDSLQDLVNFRDAVNNNTSYKGFSAANGFSGLTILVNTDIDMSPVCNSTVGSWTPIGTMTAPFKGVLNGNNKKISNLYINNSSTTYQGLFGIVNACHIDSLHLMNVNVTGRDYVGGLVGEMQNRAQVSYCSVSGKVVSNYAKDNYIGGVAGRMYVGAIIDHTVNKAVVRGSTNYTGGICGYAYLNGGVFDCENMGDVEGTIYVGGICGMADNTVLKRCVNNDTVFSNKYTVSNPDYVYLGGIVGRAQHKTLVESCIAKETAYVWAAGHSIGGVVGQADFEVSIYQCKNNGMVYGMRGERIGGVAGYVYGGTSNNTANWKNSSISRCENYGLVKGNGAYTAGVVGAVTGYCRSYKVDDIQYYDTTWVHIDSCHNYGEVTNGLEMSTRYNYTGGVTAQVSYQYDTVRYCSNDAPVTSKGGYVGGVIGDASSHSPIANCRNSAVVNANGDYVGGVIGTSHNGSPVFHCNNKSSVINNGSYAGGVVGCVATDSPMEHCDNQGSVEINGSIVGGVVGYAHTNSYVKYCGNQGLVETNGSNVGGVVGQASTNSSVACCNNVASVKGRSLTNSKVGGIVGYSTKFSNIDSCVNRGSVFAIANYLGGIVGQTEHASSVTNCDNYGTLADTAMGALNVPTVRDYTGGIAGHILTNTGDDPRYRTVRFENNHNYADQILNYRGNFAGVVGRIEGSRWERQVIEDGVQVTKVDTFLVQVKNCTNSGRVKSLAGPNVGGVIGYVIYVDTMAHLVNNADSVLSAGYNLGGVLGASSYIYHVDSLVNHAEVKTSSPTAGYQVGGVAGVFDNNDVTHRLLLTNLYNDGNVSASSYKVGGVIGYVDGFATLEHLVNKGNVTSLTANSYNVGGIIGHLANNAGYDTLRYAVNHGEVTAQSYRTGGIVGNVNGATGGSLNATSRVRCRATLIDSCVNYGNVSGTSEVAGIVGGMNATTVTRAYNFADSVQGTSNNVGGIIGYASPNEYTNLASPYFISDTAHCYINDVHNEAVVYSTAGNYHGGIIGQLKDYWSVMENATNKAEVTGAGNVGGIAGYVLGDTLRNCFTQGNVTAAGNYVGGQVGYADRKQVKGSYYPVVFDNVLCKDVPTYKRDLLTSPKLLASSPAPSNKPKLRDTVQGVKYVGGAIGYAIQHTRKNYVNLNTVIATGTYAGGYAGRIENASLLDSIVNFATVTSTDNNVGGIVGEFYGVNNSLDNWSYLHRCLNRGSITGVTYVGGIVGVQNSANVDTCVNYGNVIGSVNCTGGIVGTMFTSNKPSRLAYCLNVGSVENFNINAGSYVGGIAGSMENNANNVMEYVINNAVVRGTNHVGGIVGARNSNDTLRYALNVGHVTTKTNDTDENEPRAANASGLFGMNASYPGKVYDNYFDWQMSAENEATNAKVSGWPEAKKATLQLVADSLRTGESGAGWTEENFVFTENRYPQLKAFTEWKATKTMSKLAASPIFLQKSNETHDNVELIGNEDERHYMRVLNDGNYWQHQTVNPYNEFECRVEQHDMPGVIDSTEILCQFSKIQILVMRDTLEDEELFVNLWLGRNPETTRIKYDTICYSELPVSFAELTFTREDFDTMKTYSGEMMKYKFYNCDSVVVFIVCCHGIHTYTDSITLCANKEYKTSWWEEGGATIIPGGDMPAGNGGSGHTYNYDYTLRKDTVFRGKDFASQYNKWIHYENVLVPSSTGCDSITDFYLYVHPSYDIHESIEVCKEAFPFKYAGATFQEPYTGQVTDAAIKTQTCDCDSVTGLYVKTMNFTDGRPYSFDTVCLGTYYVNDGWEINTADSADLQEPGTYEFHRIDLTTKEYKIPREDIPGCRQCDSAVNLLLTLTVPTLTPNVPSLADDTTIYYNNALCKYTEVELLTESDFTVKYPQYGELSVEHSDTTNNGEGCKWQYKRTYVWTDSCGNISTVEHLIIVKDTTRPALASATWADSTVYMTGYSDDCDLFTLPTAYTTVKEVNDAFGSAFITDCNIDDDQAVTHTDEDVDTHSCDRYILRTYTVSDSCGNGPAVFTHKIWVKDTVKPILEGTLTDATVYLASDCGITLPDPYTTTEELLANGLTAVKDCNSSLTVTKTDVQDNNNTCDRFYIRTYKVEDACGNYSTTDQLIHVLDTVKPKFNTIDDQNATVAGNCQYEIPDLQAVTMAAVISDCNGQSFVGQDIAVGTKYDQTDEEQSIPVVVTVKDSCGNENTTTINVKIPAKVSISNVEVAGISCQGNDGAIDITPANGTTPYSYLWSTGATTEDISGLSETGKYIVTVTDANGCVVKDSAELTALPLLQVINGAIPNRPVTCKGDSDGELYVSATGGEKPYTYLWSTSATDTVVKNLPAGNYTVTVTDNRACTATQTLTVEEPEAALQLSNVSKTDAVCYGAADGTVTATVSGGWTTDPYTITIGEQTTSSTGAVSIEGLSAGTYTLQAEDLYGCTVKQENIVIDQPTQLVNSFTCTSNCYADDDGVIIGSVSGGVAPYKLQLVDVESKNMSAPGDFEFKNLADGTYAMILTDDHGCVKKDTAKIQRNEKPLTVKANSHTWTYDGLVHYDTNFVVIYDGDTSASVLSGHTYTLANNDVVSAVVTGSITTVASSPVVNVLSNIVVTRGTDTVTCEYNIISKNGTLTVTARDLMVKLDTSKVYDGTVMVSEYAASNRSFTITGLQNGATISGTVTSSSATVGTYTDSSATAEAVITTAFATSDGIGNYNVTYDFKQEITKASCITLTCPSGEAITKVYDAAVMQPSATATTTIVGDVIKVEYKTASTEWGETAISLTDAGSLDVDVRATNPNYDTATCSYTLTINQRPITVTARDTNFYFDGLGHSAAQMSTPRYVINDSTQLVSGHNLTAEVTSETISELDATTPTVVGEVTITDAGGNNVTTNYAVTKVNGTLKIEGFPGAIVITSASAELECNGQPQKKEEYIVSYDGNPITAETGSNGLKFVMPTATHDTLTVTPTFAGITTPSENADSNNVYTYALQNDTKYVGTRTIVKGTIRMYDSLKVVVTPTAVTCNGLDDGKADITITGGKKNAGNYSYKLDDGSATNTTGTVNLTNLANGSHTFYVTDSLNYDKTVNFTITQPDTLTLTLTSDNPVCEDGSVMSFTTGGNGGNKFKLNEAAEDDLGIYNHLSADSYTVTVTDSKGCSATQSVTLTVVEVTPIEGITRGGEITSYAPDTTVNASGDRTDFPSLTASGDIIAQPTLSNCAATVTGHTVSVSVNVDAIGAAPVLELEVATDDSFSSSTPMYTHKVVLTATGVQSHDFEKLPAGTYYVRAKLYNCSGSIVSESQTAVVE